VVKVDSDDIGFKSVYEDFDSGDFPCLVEVLIVRGVSSNLASLTIIERE
jgi:hypothetical protein